MIVLPEGGKIFMTGNRAEQLQNQLRKTYLVFRRERRISSKVYLLRRMAELYFLIEWYQQKAWTLFHDMN